MELITNKQKELCQRIVKISLRQYAGRERDELVRADAPRLSEIYNQLGKDELINFLRRLCDEVATATGKTADEYTNKTAANMIWREFFTFTAAQLIAALTAFCNGETSKHFYRDFDTAILHDALSEFKRNYIAPLEIELRSNAERLARDEQAGRAISCKQFLQQYRPDIAFNAGINPDELPDTVPPEMIKQIIMAQPDEKQNQ